MTTLGAGSYRAKALSAQMGKSKNKGTDYVKVVFQIIGGQCDGQTISWDGYYTEGAQDRTIDSLEICGCTFPGYDLTNFTGLDTNEVQLVVEMEEYDGKLYPRVRWVNRLGGQAVAQPMDDVAKKSFAEQMRGKLVARAQQKPKDAPATAASEPTSDDIPF